MKKLNLVLLSKKKILHRFSRKISIKNQIKKKIEKQNFKILRLPAKNHTESERERERERDRERERYVLYTDAKFSLYIHINI